MIIVNQDQNIIINMDSTGIIENDCELGDTRFRISVWTRLDMWRIIGFYQTEKRAKAVLQEIVQAYITDEKCYYMPKE